MSTSLTLSPYGSARHNKLWSSKGRAKQDKAEPRKQSKAATQADKAHSKAHKAQKMSNAPTHQVATRQSKANQSGKGTSKAETRKSNATQAKSKEKQRSNAK